MKLNEIIEFLNNKIPQDLALSNDKVGLMGKYDLTQEITSIKIFMDLHPQDDNYSKDTLLIIDGGANEALANSLNLNIIESFDKNTNIGRICESNLTYKELKEQILTNFNSFNIVNKPDENEIIQRIAVISGFGLKNPEHIKLAKDKDIDMLISGDLTQKTAILAINLNLILIDLGHHNSELPGLDYLKKIDDELNIDCEIINKPPMECEKNEC